MKKRIFLLVAVLSILAINVSGQSAKKFFKAGNEFIDNKKYEDAIVQFSSAIGLESSNAACYFARGSAYEKVKKYKEAEADYEKSMVFNPKNVGCFISLGKDRIIKAKLNG